MSNTAAPAVAINKSIIKGGAGLHPRYLRDAAARWVVWIGGLGVIAALLLIFVYLMSEVFPLFRAAEFSARQEFTLPGDGSRTLHVAAEEQGEVGMRLGESGEISFFDLNTGLAREARKLPAGEGRKVSAVSDVAPERALLAALLSDGSVLPFSYSYGVSYGEGNKRTMTPELQFPFGETALAFLPAPGRNFSARENNGKLLLAAADAAGAVHLKTYQKTENLMGESTLEAGGELSFTPPIKPDLLLIEPLLSWIYVLDQRQGALAFYKLNGADAPGLVSVYKVGAEITGAHYMAGGISVLVSQANGIISQWFPAHDAKGEPYLARVREFEIPEAAKVSALAAEQRRRGFAVGDDDGRVSVFYATAEKLIYSEKILSAPIEFLAFNPRAKYLMAVSRDGRVHGFDVHNEHPEVSLKSLWGQVWYESYDAPKWLWQSSSASADFEPKFSLTPLAFGTLKGAFYAMIFAIPLAVLGAIFTANFMSAEMRQLVKPSVEILAALPTVILGFLAGLWLAPFVETNLPGVFLVLLFLPLSVPLFGYLWLNLPPRVRYLAPAGWEAALLLPVIALVLWLCFTAAHPLEALFFGGNMQVWMDRELGISYDQRNALVVGIAMGVAVIPIIFSIAEDAIFSVPKQLSLGSMALGATPWQTLMGVVLPTASPGIFSAVMIGMGRAVGETMIVLMATGNTPVTNFSLFQGMRTLAANVAVEMPESEVGSTHFRLLFLAGLTLFIFTFILNTLAEIVRARLRARYSNI